MIIDRTGNWELTFVAGIALLLLGAVLAFWMKPDEELEDPADAERTPHVARVPAPARDDDRRPDASAARRRPDARRATGAALAAARRILGVLFEPAEGDRHRPRFDGASRSTTTSCIAATASSTRPRSSHGKIYDLEAHLDRFLLSADRSKLRLPGSREEMRDIIIQTTAASGRRDGSIRYWLSSGPGSLELTPARGAEPGFFVMIFGGLSYPERWYTEGLRVMTTTYPIKAPLYAITKATNYLPNVLMQMEAKEAGFDNGVFIDENGNVGESSNMNVAFVTKQGVLVHPKFDHILSGCTSLRLLELARAHQDRVRVAGRRGPRYSGRRGTRQPRDAAPRQLDQGRAGHPVG